MTILKGSSETMFDFEETIANGPFPIRFPKKSNLSQDEEWCEVQIDGQWKRIRFHDYREIYKVPGLYETIFYRTLRCNSPNRVSSFLADIISELGIDVSKLRVLDIGAGNGMSGEALQSIGVRKIVGIDIIEEAKTAALRDRPWVYDHYLQADLTNLTEEQRTFLTEYRFNTLCTIAALGFGDIPIKAFYTAYNLISDGGLIAFNIKDDFLKQSSGSPFATLIDRMRSEEIMEIKFYKCYQHRLNIQGQPLYYVGLIAQKRADIPESFLV